jgi:hypothetical protein
VAHVDETNFVLADSQSFDHAIDAITGEAENGVDSPLQERFDKNLGSIHQGPSKKISASRAQLSLSSIATRAHIAPGSEMLTEE